MKEKLLRLTAHLVLEYVQQAKGINEELSDSLRLSSSSSKLHVGHLP
ncbi:unnamed protein product [Allacma fusca]|uniref:Uncharacterized protein n=1 Tax=Allacma fusca TaxID=39272 RepID=A0A8J2KR25_9HEXA|nr:unnamed protein product [Allacma fusca]